MFSLLSPCYGQSGGPKPAKDELRLTVLPELMPIYAPSTLIWTVVEGPLKNTLTSAYCLIVLPVGGKAIANPNSSMLL